MKHETNNFRAPNRNMSSASQVLETCAQLKPSKEIPWNLRRTVPSHVLAARVLDENKEMLRGVRDSFRPPVAKLGVLCRPLGDNQFQIVGHGHEDGTPRIVASFADAESYAASIGRSFAFMGAIHAKV